MADRIVVMNAGRIEQVGTPMDLYDRPQSRFVAEFIGSPAMNIVEGTLHPDGVFETRSGARIDLGCVAPNVAGPTDMCLGARPENFTSDPRDIAIGQARIRVVEPTGSETLLSVKCNEVSMLILDRARRAFAVGDSISLCIPKADLHFFDSASGRRM